MSAPEFVSSRAFFVMMLQLLALGCILALSLRGMYLAQRGARTERLLRAAAIYVPESDPLAQEIREALR